MMSREEIRKIAEAKKAEKRKEKIVKRYTKGKFEKFQIWVE